MKMQRQIMDMTEYKDGNIFDNIIQINNKMREKMKLKVELRNPSLLEKKDDN
jgi:hypothetical protein